MNKYFAASSALAALLLSTSAEAQTTGDFSTPGWYGLINTFGVWMIDSPVYGSQQACQAAVNDMVARGGDASNYKCAYLGTADDLTKIQGEN
jgi:hypothetical protein